MQQVRGAFRYSHASLQGVLGVFLALGLPDDYRCDCFAGQYFLALSMRVHTPKSLQATAAKRGSSAFDFSHVAVITGASALASGCA